MKVLKVWIVLLLYIDMLLLFCYISWMKGGTTWNGKNGLWIQGNVSDLQSKESYLENSDTTWNNNEIRADVTVQDEEGKSGGQQVKKIALTFDDGPHPVYTKKLLDGLKERGVKATFFLIGKNIEENKELVLRMSQEGHCIGSHTYNHVQLTQLSDEQACEEICLTNDAISMITGENVTYIRPPYGEWDNRVECAINMNPVMWTIDPRDWEVKDTPTIVERVKKNAQAEGIILLHDIYDTSVEAALEIVDILQAEGYEFVTIDEIQKCNGFYETN